ncbi:MAG: PhoPQ-activated protein PqaA family protein, partial [Planctomycetota bacterium]|nr:PhoPQ-activated protein PqaA family protein [Planctomycetota bacterium]
MHVFRNRLEHGSKPCSVSLARLIKLVCLLISTSWLLVGGQVEAVEKPNALERYIAAEDDSYKWTLEATDQTDRGRMHRLKLVSQTWHGITWQHRLLVLE